MFSQSKKINHPRIQNLSRKKIILPYLQSICACKNKLVQNMNKYGHLTFFINLSHNF